jgi:hypothetical protein
MNTEAVGITGAVGLVLSTGLTLAALLIPGLSPEIQGAILAFGNAIVWLGAIIVARSQVFSRKTVEQVAATAASTGNPAVTLTPP